MSFFITSYVFSSAKLENKRAEHVLPGSKGGKEGEGSRGGQRLKVIQTMYTHMNKFINNKKRIWSNEL
jgi:hypothetical protein